MELLEAIEAGDLEKVDTLCVVSRATIFERDDDGHTPLRRACDFGREDDIINKLLSMGADPRAATFDDSGFSALRAGRECQRRAGGH